MIPRFAQCRRKLNDACPQKSSSASKYHGILTYTGSSPFGFSGACCYGTIACQW
jgi:hypothetical protein